MRTAVLALLLLVAPAWAGDDVRVDNLRAFAKLYGYVRFFHPADEATVVDWDRLAVYGAGQVIDATDGPDLAMRLAAVYTPIAPTVQVAAGPLGPAPAAGDGRFQAWQHYGVRLSQRSNIYQSVRVNKGGAASMFPQLPVAGEATEADLGRGVRCRVPLTVPLQGGAAMGNPDALHALLLAISNTDLDRLDARDVRVRVAGVVIAWNVFQHFYPYFDVVDVDWNEQLDIALAGALADADGEAFFDTLRRLVATLQDGHGVVWFDAGRPRGRPAIRVERIEGRLVVTAAGPGASLVTGDVIRSVDGTPAAAELARLETLVSGSPQLREHRALNLLAAGARGTKAVFEIERGGEELTVLADRIDPPNMFFVIREFDYPGIRELDGGIHHVNLFTLDRATFEDRLDDLAAAPGVIIDYRWGGNAEISMFDILPHLTKTTVHSAQWHIPQAIYPDRREVVFHESGWPMAPKTPYIQGPKVIITAPPVVSSGETIMGIVEHYELAETVGQPTAGCNGNANFISVPGGYRMMWTGMKVLKHDGSQHHLVGIRPAHPVERTIDAVLEGRDETLERAIEVITARDGEH